MSIELGLTTTAQLTWGVSNSLDLAATGGNWTIGSERRPIYGVGSRYPVGSFAGTLNLKVKVDAVIGYDANLATALTLINADGATALTTCDLTIGTVKVSGKLSGLSLKIAVDEELSGTFTIEGTAKTAVGAPSAITSLYPFVPNTIVFTGLGTSIKVASFELTIENGIKGRRQMGSARVPSVLAEGKQKVSFTMKLLEVPSLPVDITAAVLAKIAAPTVAISDQQGVPKTLTLTFTNALATEQSADLNVEDIIEHGIKYEAEKVVFGVA